MLTCNKNNKGIGFYAYLSSKAMLQTQNEPGKIKKKTSFWDMAPCSLVDENMFQKRLLPPISGQ
jgi:hypothetical protein